MRSQLLRIGIGRQYTGSIRLGLFSPLALGSLWEQITVVCSSAQWETGFWSSAFLAVLTHWTADGKWVGTSGGWTSVYAREAQERGFRKDIPTLFWPSRSRTLPDSFTADSCESWFFGLCARVPATVLFGIAHPCFLSLCLFLGVLGQLGSCLYGRVRRLRI